MYGYGTMSKSWHICRLADGFLRGSIYVVFPTDTVQIRILGSSSSQEVQYMLALKDNLELLFKDMSDSASSWITLASAPSNTVQGFLHTYALWRIPAGGQGGNFSAPDVLFAQGYADNGLRHFGRLTTLLDVQC